MSELAARERERDRHCNAGPDLHAELLPPGHAAGMIVPPMVRHPRREAILAARQSFVATAARQPGRRGIPGAIWVPGIPNFTPGRAGHDMWTEPRFLVFHTMVGWETAARARFKQPAQQASSTYGITLKGELFQYVSELDAPWTNGNTYGPLGGNLDSITFECEDGGDYNGPRTPELYVAVARAAYDVASYYNIPLDRTHVLHGHELGHRECTGAATACPDALDLDRIMATAIALDTEEEKMTDREVEAMVVQWYVNHAGRWPNAVDEDYVRTHWVPAWRQDPVKAFGDFLTAAAGEAGIKDVLNLRDARMIDLGK